MGTIRTKGKAFREVEYDRMTVSVAFNSRERRSKDAIRKVIEECESFLEDMKKLGIDISNMKGADNRVAKNNFSDEKDTNAVRTIEWDAVYDIAMINTIMKMSENASYNVDIDVTPIYTKKQEVLKELMKEATLDAKKIADLLAESLGTSIKGPSKINASGDHDFFRDEEYMEETEGGIVYGLDAREKCAPYGGGLYTELKKPTTILNKEITIEWQLND